MRKPGRGCSDVEGFWHLGCVPHSALLSDFLDTNEKPTPARYTSHDVDGMTVLPAAGVSGSDALTMRCI